MDELAKWWPTIIGVTVQIVTLVWAFASLKGDVRVLSTKVDGMDEKVKEIKNNHLVHLDAKIDKLADCMNNHLQNHN